MSCGKEFIHLSNKTSAVEREKAGKMFELNEKYKDFPERVSEYEIDGKKYIVHSRFVGEKKYRQSDRQARF